MSSTKFVFFSPIEKTRWPPWPLIGLTFLTSPPKLLNGIHRNLTVSKISRSFTKFVFFGWSETQNGRPALWLRHFWLLLWKCLTEFNETWQEAISQHPLPSSGFLGWSEKQDGGPGLWLAETFSTSTLKPLNGIQQNFTRSKISTSSTEFVFILPIRKNKMAALASDWLRHFRLLLWNRWMDFNTTWQGARSQHPLPSWSVSGRSVNKKGRPGRFLFKVSDVQMGNFLCQVRY